MSILPPPTDHAFMKIVREKVNKCPGLSMAEIAAELGCEVDDLCRWVMNYKPPRRQRMVDTTRYGPPIGNQSPTSSTNDARRFAAWRKAAEGAKAARAASA